MDGIIGDGIIIVNLHLNCSLTQFLSVLELLDINLSINQCYEMM